VHAVLGTGDDLILRQFDGIGIGGGMPAEFWLLHSCPGRTGSGSWNIESRNAGWQFGTVARGVRVGIVSTLSRLRKKASTG